MHQGNIGNHEDCERVVKEVLDTHGQLDILVNNAGITAGKTVRKMTVEDWDRVLQVNLSGRSTCRGRFCSTCSTADTAGSSTSPPSSESPATSGRLTKPRRNPACSASRCRSPRRPPARDHRQRRGPGLYLHRHRRRRTAGGPGQGDCEYPRRPTWRTGGNRPTVEFLADPDSSFITDRGPCGPGNSPCVSCLTLTEPGYHASLARRAYSGVPSRSALFAASRPCRAISDSSASTGRRGPAFTEGMPRFTKGM